MLASTVREAGRRFGDRPAFVADAGWPLSYADLDRLSDEAAAGLVALGITEGDVVALTMPSIPEYAVAYAGIAKIGAIAAGVNPRSTAAERAAVLAVADPALVLTPPELAPGGSTPVELVHPADSAAAVLADLRARGAGAATPMLDDDPERLVAIV